jgi:TolB-like protein
LAQEDIFGRDIRLENGNTASRILLVKIHDIDATDKTLLESELGGQIRSVEFIFKTPGVNRPLKPDDSRTENHHHTYYRDQINKVANAIKEIIVALNLHNIGQNDLNVRNLNSESNTVLKRSKKISLKVAIWSLLVVVLIVSGYFLLPVLSKNIPDDADKSIAVLPFENMNNDPDLDFFSNSMMQEILNHLFKIGGLIIRSGTSSMRFKDSKLSVRDIAKELDVAYVLEGNVSSEGDNVKIVVRLIDGKNEQLIWTEEYRSKTISDWFEIQSDVAQQVAEKLKITISPDLKKRIEAKPTENIEALTLFNQANECMQVAPINTEKGDKKANSTNSSQTDSISLSLTFFKAKPLLERAILLDPYFADAYGALALWWVTRGECDGDLNREEVLKVAEPLLSKALKLDKNSYISHSTLATLRLWYYWDFETVKKEIQILNELTPSNTSSWSFHFDHLLGSGRFQEALKIAEKNFSNDNTFNFNWINLAFANYYVGQQDSALKTMKIALRLFTEDIYMIFNTIHLYIYTGKYSDAIELFEKSESGKDPDDLIPLFLGYAGIAYLKTGQISKSEEFVNELVKKSHKQNVGSPSYHAAAVYTAMGENDKAIAFLEKSFSNRETQMQWVKIEPLLRPLHGDPRFDNILKKMGFK